MDNTITNEEVDESNSQIGIRELETLFNEQLLDTLKQLKCQHLKLIRGWIQFDSSVNSPKLQVVSGEIVNVYLTLSNFSDLWSRVTWKMIKDVLDRADKARLQKSVSLLDVRKFVDAKVDLYRKAGFKSKIKTLENAVDQNKLQETVIDLLPRNAYIVKVKRTSEVIVIHKNTKKSVSIKVNSKYESQAIYEGKIEIARQVLDD